METNTYQNYLEKEFAFRQLRNPNYSLRAFAKQLDLPAPKLSQILKGQGGMSPAKAKDVAKKLGLSATDAERFVNLVAMKHARSQVGKAQAETRLKEIAQGAAVDSLSLEAFKVISDWQHVAILELTGLHDFESNEEFIARRLGLTLNGAQEAVTRLFDLGLLKEEDGRWVKTNNHLSTPAGIPSQAVRSYHRQILAKADAAIENVPVEERELAAISMPISLNQMEYVRSELKALRRRLATELAESSEPKERVFCLSMQFFPLDQPE